MPPGRDIVVGILGTTIFGLLCFTPILVTPIVGLGLVDAMGWIDTILYALLILSLGLLLRGVWRMLSARGRAD